MKLTYIDLFGGAGGWSCGFEMVGLESMGFYEKEESACKTASFNFNRQINPKDLTQVQPDSKPDIIVGSPPCQGFSNEGYKKVDDPRNSLVWIFFDIVEQVSPKVWLFENVPGFKRLYKGQYFKALKERLDSMEYHWTHYFLTSTDFGVPQKRKRFFAIGAKDFKPDMPEASHSPDLNRSILSLDVTPTLWEAISDLPEVRIGEKKGIFKYDKEPENSYQRWIREDSFEVYNHTTQNHSERVLEKIRAVPVGNGMESFVDKYDENKVAYCGGYRRAKKNEPSYTAYWTRGMTSIHPEQDRFLSPRECARIQSFPDRFIFKGATIENYTQVCNAVPPLVARAFGRYLLKVLTGKVVSLNPLKEKTISKRLEFAN